MVSFDINVPVRQALLKERNYYVKVGGYWRIVTSAEETIQEGHSENADEVKQLDVWTLMAIRSAK